MSAQPLARHLLRARDLADAHYAERLSVADMARAARLSPAHFSREFKRAFGESPHQYLLTRRLERAAAGDAADPHSGLRGDGLWPAAEPHVSRRPERGRFVVFLG
jgi:hypothetical protein